MKTNIRSPICLQQTRRALSRSQASLCSTTTMQQRDARAGGRAVGAGLSPMQWQRGRERQAERERERRRRAFATKSQPSPWKAIPLPIPEKQWQTSRPDCLENRSKGFLLSQSAVRRPLGTENLPYSRCVPQGGQKRIRLLSLRPRPTPLKRARATDGANGLQVFHTRTTVAGHTTRDLLEAKLKLENRGPDPLESRKGG